MPSSVKCKNYHIGEIHMNNKFITIICIVCLLPTLCLSGKYLDFTTIKIEKLTETLKLTDDQKAQVTPIIKEEISIIREGRYKPGTSAMLEMKIAFIKQIEALLTPEQITLYRKSRTPEVVNKLTITLNQALHLDAHQIEYIELILCRTKEQVEEFTGEDSSKADRHERNALFSTIFQQMEDEIAQLLDKDQLTIYNDMKFELRQQYREEDLGIKNRQKKGGDNSKSRRNDGMGSIKF